MHFRGTLPPISKGIARLNKLHTLSLATNSSKAKASIARDSLSPLKDSNIKALLFLNEPIAAIENGSFKDIPCLESLALKSSGHLSELVSALQDMGTTPLRDLVLDLDKLKSVTDDLHKLFCNTLGQTLIRLSLVRIFDREEIDARFLFCLTRIQELTFMYFGSKLARLSGPFNSKVLTFRNLTLTFPHLKRVNLRNIGGSSSNFFLKYGMCDPVSKAGCRRYIHHYFSANQTIEYELVNAPRPLHPREGYEYLGVSPSLEHVSITNITTLGLKITPKKHLFMLDPLNNIRILDIHNWSLLRSLGWLGKYTFALGGLCRVQYLDISRNGLTSLPRLLDVYNLRVLNASHNRLGDLDNGKGWRLDKEFFWAGRSMLELNLADNMLVTVPSDIYDNFPQLEIFGLSKNRLTSVSFLSSITHNLGGGLKYVDMSDNALALLEKETVKNLEAIALSKDLLSLDFSENPFLCVCAFQHAAIWLLSTEIKVLHNETYTCSINESVSQNITTLDIHSLCPADNILLIVGISFGSATFLGILLSLALYRYNTKILVNFYLLKWRIMNFMAKQDEEFIYDAYVIYNTDSISDRRFVARGLRKLMETEWKYNLHIWERDEKPGGNMAEAIVEGILSSKKIIIVYSKSFFRNKIEFNTDIEMIPLTTQSCEAGEESEARETNDSSIPESSIQESSICDTISTSDKIVYNEWMEFTLLTAMRIIKDKPICVIKREAVPPGDVSRKWHPLLYPNPYFSPVTVIKSYTPDSSGKLRLFMLK